MHAGPGRDKHADIFLPVPAAAQLDSDGNPWLHARDLSIQLQSKAKVRTDDRANLIGWAKILEEVPKTIVHKDMLAVLVVLTDSLAQNTAPGVYPPLTGRNGHPVFQLVICPPKKFKAWAPRRNVNYVNG